MPYKDPLKRKEYARKDREKHSAKYRAYLKEYHKAYYPANRERLLQNSRDKYAKDPEKKLVKNREWRENNKIRLRTTASIWRKKRIQGDASFAIRVNLSSRLSAILKSKGTRKQNKLLDVLGCSLVELRQHLESNFYTRNTGEEMTWDNYGEWHVDHIIPCSAFDLTDLRQQKQCFHYTNLQPLWKEDNLKKSDAYEIY